MTDEKPLTPEERIEIFTDTFMERLQKDEQAQDMAMLQRQITSSDKYQQGQDVLAIIRQAAYEVFAQHKESLDAISRSKFSEIVTMVESHLDTMGYPDEFSKKYGESMRRFRRRSGDSPSRGVG
ncbi:MAG: hypothetical protein AB7L92_05455 [Alphaproteobacteria bacterium]